MIKTTMKKIFSIICLTQIICTANIETNLSSLTFKIVEDLTNLMFDDKPSIDNLKNILEGLIQKIKNVLVPLSSSNTLSKKK